MVEKKDLQAPLFKEAFLFWLKLGFISFGGPAGQIAIMHEYLVTQKRWVSESRFLNALNYCMLLPGPEAQQLATYIGWLFHGVKGGLVAGIFFVLPSLFILIGLSSIYVTWGDISWVSAIFGGLKPAVVSIIILAFIKIGKKSLHGFIHYAIALLSFIAIYFFKIEFPLIILTTVLIGILLQWTRYENLQTPETKKDNANEDDYLINNKNLYKGKLNPWNLIRTLCIGIILWILPFFVFYFLTSDFSFWKALSLFFTKAALVTFGGAYAVLPYVAQVSVEKFGWLSNLEMIDGLALGETTPGPLIMVLVFVGFMGGYHHFNNAILFGTAASITTAFYTFLPSFILIFIGAPFIERTQGNLRVKKLLNFVTAAVAGVILSLTIYLAQVVVFPYGINNDINFLNIAWILISLAALYKFKINMILWIGISAIWGLAIFIFSNL